MREEGPRRKSLRLTGYDYSQAGVYFLTVCALESRCIFGTCVGGGALDAPSIHLSEYGMAVERWIQACKIKYHDLTVLKYAIMPNHVHLLVELHGGPSRAPAPTPVRANERIPMFLSGMKRMTNRTCGHSLWQRGYHDHVVRNDADLLRIWNYIDTNPARWTEDEYYVP